MTVGKMMALVRERAVPSLWMVLTCSGKQLILSGKKGESARQNRMVWRRTKAGARDWQRVGRSLQEGKCA